MLQRRSTRQLLEDFDELRRKEETMGKEQTLFNKFDTEGAGSISFGQL
jgi:hypothetical protein